jgi:glycosyltransferase involved in cell wall biosynthesis
VLFVPGPAPAASFVAADRAALARRVRLVEVLPGRGAAQAAFAATLARRLARERPARAVLWFAAPTYGSVTLAACRLARVPCLVIAGGADVAACPDVGFGEARGGWRRAGARWTLEGAARVWAFSEAARREIEARARPRAVDVVAPAVDTAHFRGEAGPARRERLVVATCAALTAVTVRQKGIDRLLRAAALRPDIPVTVTGAIDETDARVRALVAGAPPHVSFAGFVPRDRLRALFARAAVVAQLSRHEGFGVAAVEAAAMGCRLLTTPLPVFDEVLGPDRATVGLEAEDADVAAALAAALAAPPPPDRWAELDRRYGVAVRTAAWDAWLAREGLGIGHRPPSGEAAR